MKPFVQTFSHIKAFIRLVWLGLHFLQGFLIVVVNRLRWGKEWFYTDRGAEIVQRWMRRGSRVLGLNIQVSGEPYSKSAVLVSNHISWLDIVAIAATTPVTFVSKSDLQHWPIVGVLAEATGTVFIKRGNIFSVHRTLGYLSEIIDSGRKTVFFPEGTTTRGDTVNKFNSGLFESANSAMCPVQPIAISYFHEGKADREIAPYVDDDRFVTHLWNLFRVGKIQVQLDFMDELPANRYTRYELASFCQNRIAEMLKTSEMINEDYPVEIYEVGYIFTS